MTEWKGGIKMRGNEEMKDEKELKEQTLQDEHLEQATGGHPIPHPPRYRCSTCKREFTDAGVYFEHRAMTGH